MEKRETGIPPAVTTRRNLHGCLSTPSRRLARANGTVSLRMPLQRTPVYRCTASRPAE